MRRFELVIMKFKFMKEGFNNGVTYLPALIDLDERKIVKTFDNGEVLWKDLEEYGLTIEEPIKLWYEKELHDIKEIKQ